MLQRLLTFHQVSPDYLRFLTGCAPQQEEEPTVDGLPLRTRLLGFQFETVLANPDPEDIIPELKRSGRRFNLSFTLRIATKATEDSWRICAVALYHHFDVGTGNQLWAATDPDLSIQREIEKLFPVAETHKDRIGSSDRIAPAFESSLDVLSTLGRVSTESTERYLSWLESSTLKTTFRRREAYELFDEVLQSCADTREAARAVCEMLDANVVTIQALRDFYGKVVKKPDFPEGEKALCEAHVDNFTHSTTLFETNASAQSKSAKALDSYAVRKREKVGRKISLVSEPSCEELTAIAPR